MSNRWVDWRAAVHGHPAIRVDRRTAQDDVPCASRHHVGRHSSWKRGACMHTCECILIRCMRFRLLDSRGEPPPVAMSGCRLGAPTGRRQKLPGRGRWAQHRHCAVRDRTGRLRSSRCLAPSGIGPMRFRTNRRSRATVWSDRGRGGLRGRRGDQAARRISAVGRRSRIGWVVDRGRMLRDGPELPARVATLDELLLIVKRDSGLRFDPALGFHLYGADICIQARE